jgi:hypothetical protein
LVTPRGFGKTARRDLWWLQPLAVFFGLSTFFVYANWAAFQGSNYFWGPYLSPFYSPEIFGNSTNAWFGRNPPWWPRSWRYSPAHLILWAPGLFRVTCYYYRGAYYKAFWADPPSCTVGEPRKHYLGEHSLPLIMQNIHRYFLYCAVFILTCLYYDVWKALWFADTTGRVSFGIGLGTLVLATNAVLLSGYTFGCHSMRHLTGGRLDRLSESPICKKAYDCSSCLNQRHMLWAWMSLASVMFSDIYVRCCALGVWTDWRIL